MRFCQAWKGTGAPAFRKRQQLPELPGRGARRDGKALLVVGDRRVAQQAGFIYGPQVEHHALGHGALVQRRLDLGIHRHAGAGHGFAAVVGERAALHRQGVGGVRCGFGLRVGNNDCCTGFNHQPDIRVQGAQCVSPTGKIIISAFQRQRVIARIKLPAVAAVILGAAFGANGVAVFIDHQPGQYAQGNGIRSGGWCGKSDRKITHTIIVISCTWCPIF